MSLSISHIAVIGGIALFVFAGYETLKCKLQDSHTPASPRFFLAGPRRCPLPSSNYHSMFCYAAGWIPSIFTKSWQQVIPDQCCASWFRSGHAEVDTAGVRQRASAHHGGGFGRSRAVHVG